MSALDIRIELSRRSRGGEPFRLQAELSAGGGITVVFGRSGSGKTTLLMAVLGALRPERGRIEIDGRVLFDSARGVDLPVRERRVGVVFQDALLFPHLDVRGNVAFGLPTHERSDGPGAWLARVGAAGLAGRMPAELSGGQRQRVALARALAARPGALLLDEPFSALDPAARGALSRTLVELQEQSGVPFLHVTHDLGEALRIGTRLVVLDGGRVVQSGPPAEVLARPASAAAARALGTENLFAGTVVEHRPQDGMSAVDLDGARVWTLLLEDEPGSPITLGLRAEDVLLSLDPPPRTSARNVLAGTIESVEPREPGAEVIVATPLRFRVRVTHAALRELGLAAGSRVRLLIKASAFHRVV